MTQFMDAILKRRGKVTLLAGILLLFSTALFAQQTSPRRPINIDEELSEKKPKDRPSAFYHFAIAHLYEENEEYEKAISELRKAIESDSESSELRVEFANVLFRAGSISEAVEECRKAISLNRDNSDAHYLLGRFYLQFRDSNKKEYLDKAIKEFEEVARIDKEDYRAYLTLGQLYVNNKEYQKAISQLENLIKLQPGLPEAYFLAAKAYSEIGNNSQAIENAKKCLELNPTSAQNLELLINLYAKTNDLNNLIQTYYKVLEMADNPVIRRQLGVVLISARKYENAIKELETVIKSDPHDALAYVHLGRAFVGMANPTRATENFQRALSLDGDNIEVKYYLAIGYEENGDREKAIRQLQQLIDESDTRKGTDATQTKADKGLFYRQIGFIHLRAGDPSKAIEVLTKLKEFTDNPRDYELLASAYRSNKQYSEALSVSTLALEKFPDDKFLKLQNAQIVALNGDTARGLNLINALIEANPREVDNYVAQSEIYVQAKNYSKAEEVLKRAAQLDRFNENIKFRLGAVYERAKNYDKAEDLFRELLKNDPANPEVLNYLGYMLADRNVRSQEALEYVRKAVQLDPNNGAYLDSLGWVYFRLNNLKLAEENLLKAISRLKNDPTINEHLGDLYFKTGDYLKAEEAWRRAIANGSESDDINKVKEKINKLEHHKNSKRN